MILKIFSQKWRFRIKVQLFRLKNEKKWQKIVIKTLTLAFVLLFHIHKWRWDKSFDVETNSKS
jgi:hypothetical protein